MSSSVEIKRRTTLKQRLDAIDASLVSEVKPNIFNSRLKIELAMWNKGKEVAGTYDLLNVPPSYREIERQTGRAHQHLKRWHNIYKKYPNIDDYLPIATEKAQSWADKTMAKLSPAGAHVALNSGNNEWYTPPEYIDAAKLVMGSIDTDPASSKAANQTVGAKKYYDVKADGLAKKWAGNVWMNPPYAQPLINEFCDTFCEKYKGMEFTQGCVLVNNATETEFGQKMLVLCDAVCFPNGRVKFLDPEGKPGAPLQGQMVLYFGREARKFISAFAEFGVCFKK
ncbi:MAG: hypothetical protein JRL30_29220 [Deltaproteobacteria bacterium]|nr:hypothetical protein [Deltaproteobacteria bacterium]